MQEPRWTLDELAERVETALAVDYRGQTSGRVRAVPDRRAIRWYTTIGLIDRPAAHRGRTALYGPRHLLQLVAVKRLQARGLPLVSIQRELAGATDIQLAQVARLPAGVAAGPVPGAAPGAAPAAAAGGDGLAREGGAGPGAAVAARSGAATRRPPAAAARAPAAVRGPAGGKARRAGFWREQPAATLTAATDATAPTADPTDPTTPTRPIDVTDPTFPTRPTHPSPEEAGTPWAATLRGVRLGDGATLLLEPGRELGREDIQALLDAGRPLLAALRDRGLGAGSRDPGRHHKTPNPDQGRGALDPDQEPQARPAGGTEPRREHP